MTTLHPAIASAFPAELSRFGATLRLPQGGAVPLPQLFGPAGLPALARRYAASFPGGGDMRAALSLWSQYYLLALVPCTVAAALAAGQDLPIALPGMAVVLADDALPACLCLPWGRCDTTIPCPVRRLTPLLRTHLVPVATALAAIGLPSPVFWSNAAHVLGWSLRVVAMAEADRQDVQQAMVTPRWADGEPNPLQAVLGDDASQRRVCCLRFRLGGVARCANCPAACRALTR